MKKYLIAGCLALLLGSCDKSSNNSSNCEDAKPDCTGIACILTTYNLDFRVTDPTTGADLVFGASPKYTTSDIKLYRDAALTMPISLTTDSGEKVFKVVNGQAEMYLVVAGTTTYRLSASYKVIDCCAMRVKDLRVDGKGLCTCCSDAINIPVK